MIDDILNDITDAPKSFLKNPIQTTIDIVTQPVRDGLDVIDGLTEGELREKAALRLGIDAVSGMALSELIEWYRE